MKPFAIDPVLNFSFRHVSSHNHDDRKSRADRSLGFTETLDPEAHPLRHLITYCTSSLRRTDWKMKKEEGDAKGQEPVVSGVVW